METNNEIVKVRPGKFLLKLTLFCLPIIIVLAFPLWVFYRSGELLSNDEMVARLTSDSPVLIGTAYSNPVDYLFLQSTLITEPDIVVIGSSRSGQLRSNFFKPGVKEITAYGFHKITHLRRFLEHVPAEKSPKVLMLGLDQRFFSPNYYSPSIDNIDTLLTKPMPLQEIFAKWSQVYTDYFKGKFTLQELSNNSGSAVGMLAIARGAGYRNDGSHDMGDIVESPEDPKSNDYQYKASLSFIDRGIEGFEYGQEISSGALSELKSILSQAKERNIYVVGFSPPFAPPVYEKIKSISDLAKYGYMSAIPATFKALFDSYGFGYFNFTDPKSLNLTSAQFADGTHTTERGSLMLLIKMIEADPTLKKYTDMNSLRARLQKASGEYDL
ncbi:MAG: hypothetical protein Q7R62_03800 [bacterium]|nr:hypothetical protein [bacterium]